MEDNNLTLEETEQAITTADEALAEMLAADGVIGEATLAEEMGSNDEMTDEEAEAATGGTGNYGLYTPMPTMPPTHPKHPPKKHA